MLVPNLVDGGVLHASDVNFAVNGPYGAVSASAPQTIANGTWALINFDTLNRDTDPTMWSTGGGLVSRLYLNTAGRFRICAGVEFAINATSFRAIQVRKNSAGAVGGGSLVHGHEVPAISGTPTPVQLAVDSPIAFVAGDYLEVFALQFSGGNLATVQQDFTSCAYLTARWINV